mgnify:CR=1 FL=1
MSTARPERLFTFRSGGWVLALAGVVTLVGTIWNLAPLLDPKRLRPRGDGRTAASYGVTVCPHWFHDLHAPLVAATPNARLVEYFPDDQVLNFRRLVDRQLACDHGNLVLHRGPGLGFGFDEAAIARFAGKEKPWTTIKRNA